MKPLFKSKPRPRSAKEKRSPRPFIFQLFYTDIEQPRIIRKTMSYNAAVAYGQQLSGKVVEQGNFDCLFLLDGRLPDELIDIPPMKSVWNRWEYRDGKVNCEKHLFLNDNVNNVYEGNVRRIPSAG